MNQNTLSLQESFEKASSDNLLVKYIQKRLWKQNKNWLAIMTGATGSGKSWSAVSLAEKVDPNFSIDNIILDPLDFLQALYDEKWSQGACVVFDEAGVSLSSREYMSTINRAVENILETFRRNNIAVIFTVPAQSMLDKDARRLAHNYVETMYIDRNRERVALRWMILQYNRTYNKIYYHYPKIRKGNKMPKKIKKVFVGKPSDRIISQYENKRDKYQKSLNKELLNKVKNKLQEDIDKSKPSKKDRIRELLRSTDLKPKEIADKLDTTSSYVRQIRTDNA